MKLWSKGGVSRLSVGVFINLYVSKSVTENEWKQVYEETLELAGAFLLAETVQREFFGLPLTCAVRTKERECDNGRIGWVTNGDYEMLKMAEEFFLPKELGEADEQNNEHVDALLALPFYSNDDNWYNGRKKKIHILWGNKTQSEPYHIYLLAIACLIEDRLKEKAAVGGDLTWEQCKKAVVIANKVLVKPIQMPVRCDKDRLYSRLVGISLPKEDKVAFFCDGYMGKKDEETGKFIREYFTADEISLYWERKFQDMYPKYNGFHGILRNYLEMGFALEDLHRYVRFVDQEKKAYYDNFIKAVMKTGLHLRDKGKNKKYELDRDFLEIFGIDASMFKFLVQEMYSNSIDRYMPLNNIKEKLRKTIGDYCNVEAIIEEYLSQEEDVRSHNHVSENYIQRVDKMVEEYEEQEKYEISDDSQLILYRKGNRILPELEERSLEYHEFYRDITKEERFEWLMEQDHEMRCKFLIGQNRFMLLCEEEWENILDRIKDDKESFSRYYPMVRVRIGTPKLQYLVRAFVVNDEFWAYCNEKYEMERNN